MNRIIQLIKQRRAFKRAIREIDLNIENTKNLNNMKNVIGISNFFKNNTPKLMQLIGDISFAAGLVAGLPIMINAGAAEAGITIAIPAIILKASKIGLAVGVGTKYFTKLFGQKS